MNIFKVTATKLDVSNDFNPFKIKLSESKLKYPLIVKAWEFEAESEAECRRLFDEAKDSGVTEVIGFKLDSVEKVPNIK